VTLVRGRGAAGLPEGLRVALLLSPALLVVGVFFVGGVGQAVLQSLGRQPFLGETDWSLDAYRTTFADPAFRASLVLTLRVVVISTVAATVLGVGLALLVRRWARGPLTTLLQSTLAVPHLVGALCIGLLLSPSGLLSRLAAGAGVVDDAQDFPVLTNDAFGWGIIAEYTWKEAPFIAVVALAALGPQVRALEGAARTLGAGPVRRFTTVTLPLIAPPVAAASVLVASFAAASYEVPRLLGQGFPATLPVVALQLYQDTDLLVRPQAMAVATVLAVLSLALVAAYLTLVARLTRRAL
jgi:putative spermidine/putrescine transport system permease protein